MSDLGEKIIAETRKVAASSPDFIYKQINGACKYIDNGSPSCIIGRALWNLDIIDAKCEWDKFANSSIEGVVSQEDWDIDPDEVEWLSDVQNYQDTGYPWGRAISYADDPDDAFLAVPYDE